MTIAAVTHIPTTVDHSWARNAADCAVSRANLAGDACGRVWRGGSIGYMSIRHPMEGAAQSDWDRYEREIDSALAMQNMKHWYYIDGKEWERVWVTCLQVDSTLLTGAMTETEARA